jgi:Fungal calcium binding protein
MKFYTAIALFAAAAVAAPVAEPVENEERSIVDDVKNAATSAGQQQFGANCDVTACAAALGPAAAGCGGAAAMAFADPILDAACLGTGLNDVVNKPTQCSQCSL